MSKVIKEIEGENGYTVLELLVVAAIIGILLAIAIPNLYKARISANEANARKAMQTLRDAEAEFFEQDMNNSGSRDYVDAIGDGTIENTLRCPANPPGTSCSVTDQLVDGSFTFADINGGVSGGTGTGDASTCLDSKAGYCLVADFTGINPLNTSAGTAYDDFGWEASMTSFNKTGRRDFSVYGDAVIRCTASGVAASGDPGSFDSDRNDAGCD